MKRFELELEHHYKNKFVGRHRMRARRGVLVMGQNRDADIRLLGEDVAGVHAYIEYQDGKWMVTDAGSPQGTWVHKKPIATEAIEAETTLTIGGHHLKLTPKILENEVFSAKYLFESSVQKTADKKPSATSTGTNTYHQVVVRKHGVVVRTEVYDRSTPFHFIFAGKEHVLPAPKTADVKETAFEMFTIVQRLVKSESLKFGAAQLSSQMKTAEMRAPLTAALAFLILLAALVLAIPHRPQDEMKDIKADNKYTRMVFDAELMKKKRAEAKEMRKTITAASPKSDNMKNTLSTPAREKPANTPKVVSKLKLEGLNALLGKISKRANTKGPMIVGFGKTADTANTGHSTTVAAVGSLQGLATGGTSASTERVSGVGTIGKGGGSGRGIAGIGGLATAGAGTGTVGILDEETEIEGGLDKEVIARVINGYIGEIRYCYERQLSAEPDIYGKVQVKFTIDASGAVAEHRIGNTTLNSAMVEGCILRRLARWKFPKPKGGTHVLVSYPFMFKATN